MVEGTISGLKLGKTSSGFSKKVWGLAPVSNFCTISSGLIFGETDPGFFKLNFEGPRVTSASDSWISPLRFPLLSTLHIVLSFWYNRKCDPDFFNIKKTEVIFYLALKSS